MNAHDDVTALLTRWQEGDAAALEALLPLVYDQLRSLARRHMRAEPRGHLLEPTGLVNEVYVRLTAQHGASWQDRRHFLAVSGRLMRRILVDHARAAQADKRGGGLTPTSLTDLPAAAPARSDDILALDAALDSLARLDPRQGQLVELRFFAGLTIEETAEALAISPATVKREWAVARAWLRREVHRLSAPA